MVTTYWSPKRQENHGAGTMVQAGVVYSEDATCWVNNRSEYLFLFSESFILKIRFF